MLARSGVMEPSGQLDLESKVHGLDDECRDIVGLGESAGGHASQSHLRANFGLRQIRQRIREPLAKGHFDKRCRFVARIGEPLRKTSQRLQSGWRGCFRLERDDLQAGRYLECLRWIGKENRNGQ